MNNLAGNVYVVVGDGEMQEGICYESLQFASKHHLNNLIIIIDNNKLQLGDFTANISPLVSFEKLAQALELAYISIDGHDFEQIENALDNVSADAPTVIDANTIKGKGLAHIEQLVLSHGYVAQNSDVEAVIEYV